MATTDIADSSVSVVREQLAGIREIERSEGLAAAERALVEYIRGGVQSHLAFIALARVLMKQRKFADAARAATKARSLAPLEPEPPIALGIVSIRLKEFAQAAEAFAAAIRIDPNNARAHLGAAAVKMADESYDDAIALCERVLDLDPSLERAHELIARIRMRQGRKEDAIAELKTLIAKNPGNRRVLRAYVQLMRNEGRGDEAISFLESDVAANPDDKARVARLSLVAARAGRPDIAVQQFQRVMDEGNATILDRVRYIMALIAADRIGEARSAISELGDVKMMKPVIAKLEGDIALKGGDAEAAMTQYRLACRAARVEPLPEEEEAGADTPEAKAKLWRAHALKSVTDAFRRRRAAA
ncbi:tetratricopeptide repeat protein [Frigidibacter oleivorans]|uniref:tetratricopeptide repeat protein n=1 Tax=Frigidibacter oleivorans TaxID=2487129 RepID=UPI0013DEF1F7|nr:tetratricopeptide repeat protein [Frigidibacter oleivorans]